MAHAGSAIANVGIFPPSYAVIASFTSCFTNFYQLDSYFILHFLVDREVARTRGPGPGINNLNIKIKML